MNKLHILFIFCFCFFFTKTNAQSNFSHASKYNYRSLKLGIFNPLNGEFPIYFEQKVASKSSVELGVGFTRWFPLTAQSMLCSQTFQGLPIDESKIGFFAQPSFRFYPFEIKNGLNLSIGAGYKSFNYTVIENALTHKARRQELERLRCQIGYIQNWQRILGELQIGFSNKKTNENQLVNNPENLNTAQSPNYKNHFIINCKIGFLLNK